MQCCLPAEALARPADRRPAGINSCWPPRASATTQGAAPPTPARRIVSSFMMLTVQARPAPAYGAGGAQAAAARAYEPAASSHGSSAAGPSDHLTEPSRLARRCARAGRWRRHDIDRCSVPRSYASVEGGHSAPHRSAMACGAFVVLCTQVDTASARARPSVADQPASRSRRRMNLRTSGRRSIAENIDQHRRRDVNQKPG